MTDDSNGIELEPIEPIFIWGNPMSLSRICWIEIKRWAVRIAAILCVAALLGATLWLSWAEADERVDAAIITGLDVSSSVTEDETKIQLDGLAQAMQSAEIIAAIQAGRHHRIAFAVYLWANGECPLVVGWRIIGSAEDAAAMAAELSMNMATVDRRKIGSLTGLADGMTCGHAIALQSPYVADRTVLNIVSDGTENVRSVVEVQAARDSLAADGIGVNALLLPDPQDGIAEVEAHFKANVITGPMAFILLVDKSERLIDAWRKKFIGDMS
jgi:Ca-activated chloride channel homolog